MAPLIEALQISKNYNTYVKGDSIRQSIKSLFHRKYNVVSAVQDVTFSVKPGETLGLVGLNGAGKTTIIKMVSGIIKPDGGAIRVMGRDPFARDEKYRRSVTLVMGQKGQLDVDLSIMDSVCLYAALYKIDKAVAFQRVNDMAQELGLEHLDLMRQVRTLSLGQKMKGELILAFLHLPQIVFLDEPTLGLDFLTQRSIRNYLKQYKTKYQAAIILTSHYIGDIEDLCDKLLIINRGKEIFTGTIDELRAHMPDTRTVRFTTQGTDDDDARLLKCPDFKINLIASNEFEIRVKPDKTLAVMQFLAQEESIKNISFIDDSLDVLIENLYKGMAE